MGGVVSTPRDEAGGAEEHGEHLLGVFVGERAQDLSSPFWHKLLSLSVSFHWPEETVNQACAALVQNNRHTAHLAKLLIHLGWSLQEIASASPGTHITAVKVINATQFLRVVLQYFLRHAKGDAIGEAFTLHLNDFDAEFIHLPKGKLSVPSMVLPALLSFIGSSDINPNSYLLQLELVNLLLVMMSTQLYSGPAEGPVGAHPFLDAAIMQESALVGPFVRKLLLSYIARLPIPSEAVYHASLLKGKQIGVFRKMSSAAASVLMLPYYTYSYLVSPTAGSNISKFPLADNSLHLLLVLNHYGKSLVDASLDTVVELSRDDATAGLDASLYPSNPFRQALESARDTDFDLVDIVENGQGSSVVKIPFAALYDRIGMCLSDDSSILLLYSLVHGNPAFLEYVLVRTDLDTLLMPVLEMLYNAPRRSANQIYMLLIILLILSQDSSFNASIHKLLLPGVSWYKERLLPQISLGSLMVVILIRTVKYNLSRLRDVFLHTNCLAILANMAPHMHQLNAYASQRLVSLFDMLARKYARLTDDAITRISALKSGQVEGMEVPDDMPTELHIYTDFLRIVLEIINAILTYALPRNPEVIYALLHRQELFQPFRDHPRFYELLENVYTVLDFFNVRMDDQQMDKEWSVERVLQLIVTTARSWRGDGMKTFTQLRFTYEEELHPEEFFVPYVWQLVVSHSGIQWDLEAISLFQARPNNEVSYCF
ncbi:hypothetical protein O6H91_18G017800 [Diphasiastrum complanatum]|uniref:Uncharacterized protein n=1 Tax=Diphasiastrum complanatum TaxID=34168 RepID=A0ACC2AYE8_DIPCM|nr:hypothetical protein O6H91_18G017800 [Diphasiastrum complanatum]